MSEARITLTTSTFVTFLTGLHYSFSTILPKVLPFVHRPNIAAVFIGYMIQSNILDQSTDFRLSPLAITLAAFLL